MNVFLCAVSLFFGRFICATTSVSLFYQVFLLTLYDCDWYGMLAFVFAAPSVSEQREKQRHLLLLAAKCDGMNTVAYSLYNLKRKPVFRLIATLTRFARLDHFPWKFIRMKVKFVSVICLRFSPTFLPLASPLSLLIYFWVNCLPSSISVRLVFGFSLRHRCAMCYVCKLTYLDIFKI